MIGANWHSQSGPVVNSGAINISQSHPQKVIMSPLHHINSIFICVAYACHSPKLVVNGIDGASSYILSSIQTHLSRVSNSEYVSHQGCCCAMS